MPEGWAWCRLGEIVEVSSAKRVLQQDWKKSGIPFYRAREIAQLSNNEKVIDDLFITSQLYSELKLKYGVPIAGDLMVSAVGTIGKIYIVKDTDCFYYKDASVICFSKKEKNIDSLYLKFCCESDFLQEQMYSQSKGTTVDTITINKAQNYLIPLPPISEQKKIVDSIQKFFSHIDILEHKKSELKITIKQAKSKILDLAIHGKLVPQNPNDEPAEELLKRIATSDNRPYEKVEEEPFEIPHSWKWVKLGAIGQTNIGLTYRPTDVTKTGIIVLRSSNIQDDKLCFNDIVKVANKTKILDNQFINNGDILICARNGSQSLVGKCVLISELQEKTTFGAFMAVFRSSYNQFVLRYLQSKYFKDYMLESNSTQIHQLTQNMLKEALISFPPVEEQKRIVRKINDLYSKLDEIVLNII